MRPLGEQRVGIRRKTAVRPARGLSAPWRPKLDGLYDYQKEGVLWLAGRDRALLADDMGCGKSIQAIRSWPARPRVVVVCPASLVQNWQRAIRRRDGDPAGPRGRPDLEVTIGELRRPREGEVLIVSRDGLPEPEVGSRALVLDDMSDVILVFDEVHGFQTLDAQRTIRACLLSKQCGRVIGLSGTPMPGTPENLWGVLVTIGLHSRAFGWKKTCVDEFGEEVELSDKPLFVHLCEGKPRWVRARRCRRHLQNDCPGSCRGRLMRQGYVWGEISPAVREHVGKHMLRRMKHEVLDLPDAVYEEVRVRAPRDLTKYLDEVKEQWEEVGPGEMPPFELLSEATAALARSRIDAAVEQAELMAENLGQVLVFSTHVDPILAVGKLKGAGKFMGTEHTPEKERQAAYRKFQQGKLRILALTTGAGGVGLDLQTAGGVLRVDRSWTPHENQQAVDRAIRIGQKQGVLVVDIVSDHPIETRQFEVLGIKTKHISQAVGL